MSNPRKFDFERLDKYCKDNNIQLLEDYSFLKINRDSKIKGKCIYENCANEFYKNFRELEKTGGYCKICIKIIANDRRKKFCIDKYGVDNCNKNKYIREKIKNTNLKKYGVEYSFQANLVKDKIKEVCLEKYGVENPMQNKNIKKKATSTCLKKYGFEYSSQNEENRKKYKNTCLQRYGVENPSQSQEFKNKKIETSLKNWGVEHPCQNSEIMEKSVNTSFSKKFYTFPSGRIDKIQGYESFALDDLIICEKIDESNIITGCSNVPKIWYNDENGIKRRHFVDIYIPLQNKCVEVKSTWTFKKENVLCKQNAAKELGYNYEIWVYNEKGKKICYL